MDQAIFSTAYLPNCQYISKITACKSICIEIFDSYSKQSYRNRCEIYGANGKQTLSIPVKKGNTIKTLTKDIIIDYDTNWQKNHWKSIESAYNSSPYFEFYYDDFKPFYFIKEKYLIDYNEKLLGILLDLLEINTQIKKSEKFFQSYQNIEDYRFAIHPKIHFYNTDNTFIPVKYNQVFQAKYGFIPNLSIIDLLFNEGPNSYLILMSSIRKGDK